MNVNTEKLKDEIEKLINELGISIDDLANKAKISKVTLYSILSKKTKTTQRAVARKIAEATGHYAVFEGDQVKFYKLPPALVSNFRRNLRHLLQQQPALLQNLKTTNPQLAKTIQAIMAGQHTPTYSQMKDIAIALGQPFELLVQPNPLIIPQTENATTNAVITQYMQALAQPEDTLRLLLDPYEYQIIQLLRQLPRAEKAKIMDVLKILFEDKLEQPKVKPQKKKPRE